MLVIACDRCVLSCDACVWTCVACVLTCDACVFGLCLLYLRLLGVQFHLLYSSVVLCAAQYHSFVVIMFFIVSCD